VHDYLFSSLMSLCQNAVRQQQRHLGPVCTLVSQLESSYERAGQFWRDQSSSPSCMWASISSNASSGPLGGRLGHLGLRNCGVRAANSKRAD